MKRFHVHVAADDLKRSIGFYSALFAAEPTVIKSDYAEWMLDDPSVNFAISTRGRQLGLDHLGIQADSGDELKEIYARLHKAGGNIVEQGQTACCYAKSEKSWIDDPAGISWEAFHTTYIPHVEGAISEQFWWRVSRGQGSWGASLSTSRSVSCSQAFMSFLALR